MNDKKSKKAEQEPEILATYRKELVEVKNKLNESYDKLVIALAGGALALSISFLKDVVSVEKITCAPVLLSAWALFVVSLASVLGEILFGIAAQKEAIKQVDAGTIYESRPGGKYSTVTTSLHWSASVALILGLLCISFFAFKNIGVQNVRTGTTTETTTNSAASAKSESRTPANGDTKTGQKLGADPATSAEKR